MKGFVNWEALQRLQGIPFQNMSKDTYSKRWAEASRWYDGMAKLETKYTENQVRQMILHAGDTVVDIGCGPGRLAIPIAQKVKQVTAVDISSEMLDTCMENARVQGVDNVVPLELDWMEEGAEEKVGQHDIAVASRSVGLYEIRKLNQIARKYVFLIGWAGGPSLREIQLDFLPDVSIGKIMKESDEKAIVVKSPNDRMFGYNLIFNIAYDLGLDPNVVLVDDGFERDYKSKEEAYSDLRFIGEIPPDGEEQYRANVDKYLVALPEGGFKLLRKTKSYVMWWATRQLEDE